MPRFDGEYPATTQNKPQRAVSRPVKVPPHPTPEISPDAVLDKPEGQETACGRQMCIRDSDTRVRYGGRLQNAISSSGPQRTIALGPSACLGSSGRPVLPSTSRRGLAHSDRGNFTKKGCSWPPIISGCFSLLIFKNSRLPDQTKCEFRV